MPTWKDERPDDQGAERKPPEEGAPRRAAAEEEEVPTVQLGEDPGTVDPEAD